MNFSRKHLERKRSFLQLEVEPHCRIPFWYGLAWYRAESRAGVYYPIGLNLILRGLYLAHLWVSRGGIGYTIYERRLHTEFMRGQRVGFEQANHMHHSCPAARAI